MLGRPAVGPWAMAGRIRDGTGTPRAVGARPTFDAPPPPPYPAASSRGGRRTGARVAGASEAVVVGGGVIGCGIAFELARRGVRVTLLERGRLGGEASWASAGIVSPPSRPEQRHERVELGNLSLRMYPSLVADLEERTGLSLEYRKPGEWTIAIDAEHAAHEAAKVAWQQSLGYPYEAVDPVAARRDEPALPETTVAAWFTPEGATVTVQRLAQAYALAAERLGATIREETPAGAVLHDGRRVTGVALNEGRVDAPLVVLAGGAWTRFLGESVGVVVPTKPVKGQLIAFRGGESRPTRVINGHHGYVRPRVDGTTTVAATEEEVGFDRRVTGDGVAWLLDLTSKVCPSLLAGEVVATWTGLRPGSETGEPIIGPVPGWEGLWVATGHFRTGAKEGPATADLVARSIVEGAVSPLLVPFAPAGSPA